MRVVSMSIIPAATSLWSHQVRCLESSEGVGAILGARGEFGNMEVRNYFTLCALLLILLGDAESPDRTLDLKMTFLQSTEFPGTCIRIPHCHQKNRRLSG